MEEEQLKKRIQWVRLLSKQAAQSNKEAHRQSTEQTLDRLEKKLEQFYQHKSMEYRFRLEDNWQYQLLDSLLREYGFAPYRYPKQRYTTLMVRLPRPFVEQTLWPSFRALSQRLKHSLAKETEDFISKLGRHRGECGNQLPLW